jgi:imidazolonepropionase-like amidohydrolase
MTLTLSGGTIYVGPTEDPVRDGVVLIEDETIAAVGPRSADLRSAVDRPPVGRPNNRRTRTSGDSGPEVRAPQDATVLDCSGLSITAGFWNSHVHFFERKWADAAALPAPELARQLEETFTRYGFTSVFDLGSSWENTRRLRDRIESGEVPGPRILSTGEGLIPPGAAPSDQVLHMMGVVKTALPEVADAALAAAAARRLLDAGVDGIKLFASSPRGVLLPDGAMEAAVDAAHGAGKPVFVHPNSGADVLRALRAGVDVIAHTTPHGGAWELAAIGEHALTPTLALWKSFARHDRIATQERIVTAAAAQLRAWIDAGGTVLFGTDLGAVDPDPSEEYALMAAAGMSVRDILASLTTAPAKRFGQSGRIAAGERADIAVWDGDLAAVRYTIRAGKIVYRMIPSS